MTSLIAPHGGELVNRLAPPSASPAAGPGAALESRALVRRRAHHAVHGCRPGVPSGAGLDAAADTSRDTGARLAAGGRVSNAQPGAPGARIPAQVRARDLRRLVAAPA